MDKVSSHVVRKVCQDEFELLRGNAALSVFAEHLRIYIDQLLSLLYNICSILNVVTFNAFSNQSLFLAVQDSSIGDLVTHSLTEWVSEWVSFDFGNTTGWLGNTTGWRRHYHWKEKYTFPLSNFNPFLGWSNRKKQVNDHAASFSNYQIAIRERFYLHFLHGGDLQCGSIWMNGFYV